MMTLCTHCGLPVDPDTDPIRSDGGVYCDARCVEAAGLVVTVATDPIPVDRWVTRITQGYEIQD